jgi:hypothetical protein
MYIVRYVAPDGYIVYVGTNLETYSDPKGRRVAHVSTIADGLRIAETFRSQTGSAPEALRVVDAATQGTGTGPGRASICLVSAMVIDYDRFDRPPLGDLLDRVM